MQCACCAGMLGSQYLLVDLQSFLEEPFGLGVLTSIFAEPCKVKQCLRCGRSKFQYLLAHL